jgi:hypothetical protein
MFDILTGNSIQLYKKKHGSQSAEKSFVVNALEITSRQARN